MNAPTQHEAAPMNTDANIAVMAVEVRYIKEAVERMERSNEAKVSRHEWEQRNVYVDGRFVDAFAKIAEVSADAARRRAPWWTIVAAAAGCLAVVAYLIDIVPQVVN